jgi:molybdopterin synthase sulfur carrier subunit
MELNIALFAGLRCANPDLPCNGQTEFLLEIAAAITVRQLRNLLGINPAMPLIVMVNNHHEQDGFLLAPGDRVGMFPPIGGG